MYGSINRNPSIFLGASKRGSVLGNWTGSGKKLASNRVTSLPARKEC
jgi:hypothetical protein